MKTKLAETSAGSPAQNVRSTSSRLRAIARCCWASVRRRSASASWVALASLATLQHGTQLVTHSPLYHRHDIASVEAYREGGDLAGARVTFKAVPGLSPAYLSHALLCHRARMATLGYPTTYMAYDPAMLVHTHLAVDDQGGPIVVTIRADHARRRRHLVGPADAAARRGADLDRRGRSGRRGGVGRGRGVDGHGGVERRRGVARQRERRWPGVRR